MARAVLTALAFIAALAVLGRIRGGGMDSINMLPGRPMVWAAGGVALASWLMFGWQASLIIAAGYLIWAVPGWGLWFDLHRQDKQTAGDPRHNGWFERAIGAIAFGSDHLALFWRHAIFIAPLVAGLIWLAGASAWWLAAAPSFGAAVVAVYEASQRLPGAPWTKIAEPATGALIAVLCLLLLGGCSQPARDYLAGQAGIVELAVRDALPPPKPKPSPPMCPVTRGNVTTFEPCKATR